MGRGNRTNSNKLDRSTKIGSDTIAEAKVLYHTSSKKAEESILAKGLVSGRKGFTKGGDFADDIYGKRPVYLSLNPNRSRHTSYLDLGEKQTIYEIDKESTGTLLPDLPGLVDAGATLDEEGIYWEEGEEPEEMIPYLDDGYISFDDLLNFSDVIEAAIDTTGTAAIREGVPKDSIKIAAPSAIAILQS